MTAEEVIEHLAERCGICGRRSPCGNEDHDPVERIESVLSWPVA